MDTIRARKRKKWYLLVYLYMLTVLFTLLVTASYTWFSLSQTPRVSDLYMFINTPSGLEISLDPSAEEWELQLDFRDMVSRTSPLRPVTWSDEDQCFYTAYYGSDGRVSGHWEPLNDGRHANKDNADGYYVKATFYARSGQPVAVSLSPAVEIGDGTQGSGTYLIGYPVWDASKVVHIDGGISAQNAMRVGFRITPVDTSGTPTGAESELIIYEPNFRQNSGDLAETVTDPETEEGTEPETAPGSEWDTEPESAPETEPEQEEETASEQESETTETEETEAEETPGRVPPERETVPVESYVSDLADQVPGYVPTPSIDGTADLVSGDRLILQTGSWWEEAYPVQRDVLIRHMGKFVTDPYLFSLEENEIVRIELYVWLEGQDMDCTNEIKRAQILASIQFAMKPEDHSGLVPIPE